MSAWPRVVARLIEAMPALPGWDDVMVFDGPPVTRSNPKAYCTVGYVLNEDFGGSYERDRGAGDLPTESGNVRCELVCKTGQTDVSTVRARAFGYVDVLQDWVEADTTLGALNPGSTADLSVDVEPVQNDAGAVVRVALSINYTARL